MCLRETTLLICLLCGMGAWNTAWSADNKKSIPAADPIARLQTFLDQTKTMQAEFFQQVDSGSKTEAPVESQGHFIAAKPGRFLWSYAKPMEQLILSDGQQVWFYEPDLKQATRSSTRSLEGSFARLLTTSGEKINDRFEPEVVTDTLFFLPTVRLRPKQEESAFRQIEITMHQTDNVIVLLTLEDPLGNRSRITFEKTQINQPVDEKQFTFTPPKGVEVIDK